MNGLTEDDVIAFVLVLAIAIVFLGVALGLRELSCRTKLKGDDE